ncbi:MAG: acyl-ACP--UDP-N-acetylglucosamine O-acyltransferase [Sinobacterium sp.]|nr:acyl-ACP--UDP-N-acetylglucosamine O-acyltransferase [Sinobacterium sp.]
MIHPTAIIDPSAVLADNVEVGPFTLIGADVTIGAGTVVHSHVVIKGPTTIGESNEIYQFSTVGDDTPDLKYNGEATTLEIGDRNVIREGVTIHRGTVQDKGYTRIGNDNLIMAYAHIGHDSVVGNNTILVNNASLAGHVEVGDWAIISGYSLIHQFCKIGEHSFLGYGSGVSKDVPAYVMANGMPAQPFGINVEGLKRRNFSKEDIALIRKAYKIIYRQGHTMDDVIKLLQPLQENSDAVKVLVDSLLNSTRGIVR